MNAQHTNFWIFPLSGPIVFSRFSAADWVSTNEISSGGFEDNSTTKPEARDSIFISESELRISIQTHVSQDDKNDNFPRILMQHL